MLNHVILLTQRAIAEIIPHLQQTAQLQSTYQQNWEMLVLDA